MISPDNIVRIIEVVVKHLIVLRPEVYQIRGTNSMGRPAYTAETLLTI